eukprot:4615620-Pyramimonas_sp.AAC.1
MALVDLNSRCVRLLQNFYSVCENGHHQAAETFNVCRAKISHKGERRGGRQGRGGGGGGGGGG